MKLEEQIWGYTVEDLKKLIRVCGGPGPEGTRKEFLVRYLVERLTDPASVEELWERLDPLSQKAVAAAFHNGGEFDEEAFVAQYGERPAHRGSIYTSIFSYSYNAEPHPLDLLLHHNELPRELMTLLEPLVPPPERFRLQGLADTPVAIRVEDEEIPLLQADTEEAGLHDLAAYLRLVKRGALKHTTASQQLTATSARTILGNLLEGDFFAHEERVKIKDTIRPFGLDVFARTSGLVRGYYKLSDGGEALLQSRSPEALLDAFETWANEGHFDELSRISTIKGQKSKRTRLSPSASRRQAIVEALSWCPTGVWISIPDFLRALKIWHFDFEIDLSNYGTGLYVGDAHYGWLGYADDRSLVKELYTKAVLMEYLGSIGVLDVVYLPPEDVELGYELYDDYHDYYSPYDGLLFFRINPLGAYLLGQAGEYAPSQPADAALFSIDPVLVLTLKDPDALTPNLRHQLGQFAVEQDRQYYRLDTQQILNALESGSDLEHIADFLAQWHEGPLPAQATDWLEEIQDNTRAFKSDGNALLLKARSQELIQLVAEDPVLGKFSKVLVGRTLVIPKSKEKAFRERLKELGYLLP